MYDAYNVLELAKYIVTKCIKDHCPISNLQLQKILYFIQREFLQKKGRVAFYDEIQAWQFGPVVRNVYAYFCAFGGMPIEFPLEYIEPKFSWYNDDDKRLVDSIVEKCRALDPWALVNATHRKDGAWDRTYCSGVGYRRPINIEWIKDYG